MMDEIKNKIDKLQGPILILGASGFIGANLFRMIKKYRSDVYGTSSRLPTWRLEDQPSENLRAVDLLNEHNTDVLLNEIRPATVFNCVAYGAYSFQRDTDLIYTTNFLLTERLIRKLNDQGIAAYIHAGSSSEYGDISAGPDETTLPSPNSDYAVSKVSCANLLHYYGSKHSFPCVNLRLYSIYGPYEDSSRLIPAVIANGVKGKFPSFVSPNISRDFVFIDDTCEAFIDAALSIAPEIWGASINIGSGVKTTIEMVAATSKSIFDIEDEPVYSMPARDWDVADWYADNSKAQKLLKWKPRTSFEDGLKITTEWFKSIDEEAYKSSSKLYEVDTKHSVTAIIACYKDGQAIPIMYKRLKDTFEKLRIDYEIIFVNDRSPDDSEEVIRKITEQDRHVVGISHSRNFGSQSAFRSGMEIATKNACVLLDGDLQDPPELIEQFVEKWREGYDIVYGRRVKREAPLYMQIAYKLFYRIFEAFSYIKIPRDAGDFSLIDHKAVKAMLRFPERDFLLRGIRAFVGFKQIGIDYVRPERMFGQTTNNFLKNIYWAKKGILSYSDVPLTILSYCGFTILVLTMLAAIVDISLKIFFPWMAPKGVTTLLLVVLFFGSINLFALGVIADYIAKIIEEVKRRPHFIRQYLIKNGHVRSVSDQASSLNN